MKTYPLKDALLKADQFQRGCYRQPPNGKWGYLIEERVLKEHIDDYDRMDNRLRAEFHHAGRDVDLLYHSLAAVYHSQGKDSDKTIRIVMSRLLQLIEEKQKLNTIDFRRD